MPKKQDLALLLPWQWFYLWTIHGWKGQRNKIALYFCCLSFKMSYTLHSCLIVYFPLGGQYPIWHERDNAVWDTKPFAYVGLAKASIFFIPTLIIKWKFQQLSNIGYTTSYKFNGGATVKSSWVTGRALHYFACTTITVVPKSPWNTLFNHHLEPLAS